MAKDRIDPEDLLGNLVWNGSGLNSQWESAISISQFEGFGTYFHDECETVANRAQFDDLRLFRKGKFRVVFEVESRYKRISESQRDAWEKFIDRGDQLWSEILENIFNEYQQNYQVRFRWWDSIYGKQATRQALPRPTGLNILKKIIRPAEIRVDISGNCADIPDIGIAFNSTYGPFGVLIKGGRVFSLVDLGIIYHVDSRPDSVLQHPILGLLKQWRNKLRWRGLVRCRSFREYRNIAKERAFIQRASGTSPIRLEPIRWDFIQGDFELNVFTSTGVPTDIQAKTLRKFLENEKENVSIIMHSLFEEYKRNFKTLRQRCADEEAEEDFPFPRDSAIMYEHVQLQCINIFNFKGDRTPSLGFEFCCSWDFDGVRWQNGKVAAVGFNAAKAT